jgi:hypothetical protein
MFIFLFLETVHSNNNFNVHHPLYQDGVFRVINQLRVTNDFHQG